MREAADVDRVRQDLVDMPPAEQAAARRAAGAVDTDRKAKSTSGAFGITVLYPAKGGEAFNYDYYFNNHHKLVVSRLKPEGLVSREFDKGVSDPAGNKAPYLAIAYLKFNFADELQKALAKHGAEIVGDIPKLHENRTESRPLHRISRTTRALHISGVIWLTVKILAARQTRALGRDDD
jgi:uncharacterized protein (TIGR02118 family)